MKTALVSLINSKFVIAYRAFIKSLLYKNPWFDLDFVLFNDGVSLPDQVKVKAYYPNIIFKDIDYRKYDSTNWDKTKERLKCTYYKLEMFSLYEYDRIVFIDLDTVVLQDLKDLFEQDGDICAVRGYNRGGDCLRNDINSGVLVLNKPVLNEETYEGVVDLARQGHSLPDQHVINKFFKGKITHLDKKFNVEKRMFYSKKFDYSLYNNNIAILHYVGVKPWQSDREHEDYSDIERAWWVYYRMLWRF